MLRAQKRRCYVCGEKLRIGHYQDDHMLARIDGGSEDLFNRALICTDCHKRKSAREHKNNAKAKRLAGGKKRRGPKMRSKGFDKTRSRRFDGTVTARPKKSPAGAGPDTDFRDH